MSKTPRFQVQTKNERTVPPPTTRAITFRLPDDLHRWMTMKARDERTSMQEILNTALRTMQKKAG
jgi:hypothetical protein